MCEGSDFSTSSPALGIGHLLIIAIPVGVKWCVCVCVFSHCGFGLHFLDGNDVEPFFMFIGHLQISEVSIYILSPFKKLLVFLLLSFKHLCIF